MTQTITQQRIPHQCITDFHIHSRFAYATSKEMNLSTIYRWSKLKGIHIIGTGDCLHPSWLAELQQRLVQNQCGFFELTADYAQHLSNELPLILHPQPQQFVLSTEVSTVYKRDGKVRKVHTVLVLSQPEKVVALQQKLQPYGNLAADGRPTVNLDTEQLLEIVNQVDDQAIFFPAHAWTPWFGVFGSKSGFDTLAEAFGQLASQVYAVETGLSSDPFMNWQIPELRQRSIISTSDAHSPDKLGREATIFKQGLTYTQLRDAIVTNGDDLIGTIEFYPEEGKYHLDGHRECSVVYSPEETKTRGGACHVCGRPVTVGVLSRVQQLATVGDLKHAPPKVVEYIVPLKEIIAQSLGLKSTQSKKVHQQYMKMISSLGCEFSILRTVPIADIARQDEHLALGINNMRSGQVTRIPGYDSQYGQIHVYGAQDSVTLQSQRQQDLQHTDQQQPSLF